MPEQNPNKILDLMKEKYGLSHISKAIAISPSDTLFSIYRKTARYLYKNGMDNGDYGDKDEIIALSHQLEVPKETITKVDSSNLVPEEKAAFVKLFKFKNTANDKWEDHIYQYLENGKRNYIFIKPNGSITPTYYGIKRFWKDTNKRIQDLASLNNYYSGENKQIAPWLTRAKDENEKVYFTAYSRNLLIGYDKLNTDIKKSFNQKLEHDTAFSSNKDINKRFTTLIANLNNPENGGKGRQYLFTADGSYDFFNKNSHTPSYDEWKKAENNTPLKVYVKDNDNQSKENITKELSKLLISNSDQDQMIIPKSSLQLFLASNEAIHFTTQYLKKTYNLTLQNQYDLNQAKSSHAKYFQTKKNIDKSTLVEMNKLSTELSNHFKNVEIDNDVDLNDLRKFIPELKDTLSVLPHSLDDTKPVLRFRKLKNHKALGMFTPINNTLAIDFRYNKDTKETGLQSFVHEYGHFLDYNYNKNGLPLSLSNAFSSSLQSSQSELENNQLTKKELTYLETPSEVFARAFETYASHNGLNNSTIQNKEIYNSKDVRFATFTPEIRKNIFNYFDKQFPEMKQKIQNLSQQNTKNMGATKHVYRYYSPFRPINPGTFPKESSKPLKIKNFDERKNVGANLTVWGYIEYPTPLSTNVQQDYDLIDEKPLKIARHIQNLNLKKNLNLTDISLNMSKPTEIESTIWENEEAAKSHRGMFATIAINTSNINSENSDQEIQRNLVTQLAALSNSKYYDPKFTTAIKAKVDRLQHISDQTNDHKSSTSNIKKFKSQETQKSEIDELKSNAINYINNLLLDYGLANKTKIATGDIGADDIPRIVTNLKTKQSKKMDLNITYQTNNKDLFGEIRLNSKEVLAKAKQLQTNFPRNYSKQDNFNYIISQSLVKSLNNPRLGTSYKGCKISKGDLTKTKEHLANIANEINNWENTPKWSKVHHTLCLVGRKNDYHLKDMGSFIKQQDDIYLTGKMTKNNITKAFNLNLSKLNAFNLPENKLQSLFSKELTQQMLVITKREMRRQAYLISRGRMEPNSNTKTMELAKTFENSKKSNEPEKILFARNNKTIDDSEFRNSKVENQLNRVFAKKIIKENKLASDKDTLHKIVQNIAWNRAYSKANHLDSSAHAGYTIEKKLFNNKEYKTNFLSNENKQNKIKKVSHHQNINLFQNQDLNM